MHDRRMHAFTLIEVLIVMAIIAVLASIAYPSYQESVRKTRRAEARAMLMQLMQQQERFYSQNTRYVAFSSQSSAAEEKKFKWYSGDGAASSAYEISGAACDGDTIENCVLLTAIPGTSRVNKSHKDPACGNLMLTSTGIKSASGNATGCW
jgi:type IV pilus assembly protein PilE